jgi:hypothetical protein
MPDLPKLPPVAKEPLSLVLLPGPAEANYPEMIRAWSDLLRERGGDHEILLVADTDTSTVAVQELLAATPGLRVVSTEGKQGLGAALRVGLSAAALPLLACAPCDPLYQPKDLKRLLAEIDPVPPSKDNREGRPGVHLVAGFRAGRPLPWPLRWLGAAVRLAARIVFGTAPRPLPGWLGWRGYLGSWLARVFFGVGLRDVGCPFFVCRREILARAPLQSDGDFALVELLAKLNFIGCVFHGDEIPLAVPARTTPLTRQRRRQLLREAFRVFAHPDFGPPQLPEQRAENVSDGLASVADASGSPQQREA